MAYDLRDLRAPVLSGSALKAAVFAMEHPLLKRALGKSFDDASGMAAFRALSVCEPPTPFPYTVRYPHQISSAQPIVASSPEGNLSTSWWSAQGQSAPRATQLPSLGAYASAYSSLRTSPEEVAERILKAIQDSDEGDKPLRCIVHCLSDDVMAQARASSKRYARGEALSPLDGVPVAVKDELDQMRYPTKVGTRFIGTGPASSDAEVVARLRRAGALLFAKTHMHEIGIGVTGLSEYYGVARNPYDRTRHTGGSSSGSAAAVAAGLCPLAVGADGGGSIRIPGALCGVVGLKPTFGRLSEVGAYPLCSSVAHVGLLGWSAVDVALAYGIVAGPDPNDLWSLGLPPVVLPSLSGGGLRGWRLGIYRPWYAHADADVLRVCDELVAEYQRQGATVVSVEIPELEAARVAHLISIVAEMVTTLQSFDREHRGDYGLDTRLNLAVGRGLSGMDYLKAQSVRTRAIRNTLKALEGVDVLLTPSTACVAPSIVEAALPHGTSDLSLLNRLMRFAFLGNLTGFPGISFPAGYTSQGLPVGIQAMGRPFDEARLLELAILTDSLVPRQKAASSWNILPT